MQELKKRRGGPTAASKGDEARSKFITKVKELKLKDPKVESQAEAEAIKNNLPDHIIKKLKGFFFPAPISTPWGDRQAAE